MVRRRKRIENALDVHRKKMIKSTRVRVAAQIEKDFADMEDFPFDATSKVQGKRVVVSDGTQMEMMRFNKRFKPGD